ncbi:hypothetical protein ABIA19_001497 [Sinorhizobium fredii]
MQTEGRVRTSAWFSTWMDAKRPGLHVQCFGMSVRTVEDEGKVPPLPGRLAADVEELRRMRHWLEDDDELGRKLQRDDRLFARRQFQRFNNELVELFFVIVLRQVDAGAPIHLAEIFDRRHFMRVMRLDVAYPRAYRERHLDHFVEGRLVAGGAERAGIFRALHRL